MERTAPRRDQPLSAPTGDELLRVEDLRTYFFHRGTTVRAVDGISYQLNRGEVLGVVGESGSGKTVSGLSLLRLIDSPPGRIVGGRIWFDGQDLLSLSEAEMREIRGNEIAMIFQEPLTSLNPVFTVGDQIVEALVLHRGLTRAQAREETINLLARVGIPNPPERFKAYPHQLSGGMRQRAMIAMALSCRPKLLIADEPTTALDVSIQAQILELMKELQRDFGMAMIFITHDLGVISEVCDRVNVMYAGRIVEQGTTPQLFTAPRHPYTWGLLDCLPRIDEPRRQRLTPIIGQPPNLARLPSGCTFHPRCPYAWDKCRIEEPPLFRLPEGQTVRCWLYEPSRTEMPARIIAREEIQVRRAADRRPLLEVEGLVKHFPITRGILQRKVADVVAVDGIDFTVYRGETLGLVGESGCGKTTTGRLVLRLLEPTAGAIRFDGVDLRSLKGDQLRSFRRRMQIVFQDPFSSLNPRRTVGSIIAQPIEVHQLAQGREVEERVRHILERVGLNPAYANRYPHEFSGGQRQRIGIARAIAANPDFIVLDEPVSALDVSIQAQIINLLQDLQLELGLSYIFIAHDLSVVRAVSDRVAVMYLGKIVELAENAEFYGNPLHPYTRALLSAVPRIDPDRRGARQRIILPGDVPSPINPPSGCRFHTRCPYRFTPCDRIEPRLRDIGSGHFVACHLYDPEFAEQAGLAAKTVPASEAAIGSPGQG
ncbi:ABC transporter ATP-binding protein [Thermalbibacter longus]|uniref:ABC transporter ATP-binding protein n=1 Tax=Thermalbibacter longus TaxID=2951981 RepID=UPI0024C35C47|nr:ABC transporter ATP-binding protein [Thermalbibacter longus]